MDAPFYTLLILRHAKSAWNSDASTDFDRPLSKRGKRDAPRIGKWLFEHGLIPDIVLSSPAKRAQDTTLKVCEELKLDKENIKWDLKIYQNNLHLLLEVLANYSDAFNTVLIVGHNPGLEALLEYLCEDDMVVPKDEKLLPTATIAQLNVSSNWASLKQGVAEIVSITRPRSLL